MLAVEQLRLKPFSEECDLVDPKDDAVRNFIASVGIPLCFPQ